MERLSNEDSPGDKKEAFRILNEDLASKPESELTPEEQETEVRFRKEEFGKFLGWINNNEVLVHAIGGEAKDAPLPDILEQGLLSAHQLEKLGTRVSSPDWQEIGVHHAWHTIRVFQDLYKKLEDKEIAEEEFEQGKEDLLKEVPEIGRERIRNFLDKIIPSIIREVGYPIESRGSLIKGADQGTLGIRNPLASREVRATHKTTSKEKKNIEAWTELPNVMSGFDLVSSTSSERMKRDFLKGKSLLDSVHPSPFEIYFDKPNELRLYELTSEVQREPSKKSVGSDIGVSNRVYPNRFRALRFGFYDEQKRVLLLKNKGFVNKKDLPALAKQQENGVVLMDGTLSPLPPLSSIEIQDNNLDESFVEKIGVNQYHHPDYNEDRLRWLRGRIESGELTNWGMSLDEFDERVKNDYLLNLIMGNEKKTVAMMEEMGGIENTQGITPEDFNAS